MPAYGQGCRQNEAHTQANLHNVSINCLAHHLSAHPSISMFAGQRPGRSGRPAQLKAVWASARLNVASSALKRLPLLLEWTPATKDFRSASPFFDLCGLVSVDAFGQWRAPL